MKVLFINPPGLSFEYMPLGLAYIAAVLRDNGHSVAVLDMAVSGTDLEFVLDELKKTSPDIVGFSSFTSYILETYEIINAIKARFPGITIIVGGPHATVLPEYTLKECPNIDYITYGEGENTVVELLDFLEKRTKSPERIDKIKGLCWKDGDSIKRTPPRELIQDLDTIPFPARELFKKYKYPGDIVTKSMPVESLMSSRGCPFNCAFCSKGVFGRTYRRRSPGNVVAEIKEVCETSGTREFYFMDDLFATNVKWLNEFFAELEREKIDIDWKCLGRVDSLDEKTMLGLKQHGCHTLQFGVESGNDEILKSIGKEITTDKVRVAFKNARNAGLNTYGFFILGHPGETMKTAWQTINFARELNPDFASFFVLTPFPGTRVYDNIPKDRQHDWKSIHYYSEDPVSMCEISPQDLARLMDAAYFKFFFNPAYVYENLIRASTSRFNPRILGKKIYELTSRAVIYSPPLNTLVKKVYLPSKNLLKRKTPQS